MFLEHAFAFSIVEALVSALIFAYIQRTDTSIFYAEKAAPQEVSKKSTRDLAIGMLLLIILTPLGLLAAGTAYGEWAPEELKERVGYVPPGLEKLSDLWHALNSGLQLFKSPSGSGIHFSSCDRSNIVHGHPVLHGQEDR